MKVNSNIQGMLAQSILARNEEKMQASTQKMSSGFKINKSKDNPAGMAITNRMKAQLKSLDRANKNANNAVNAIQTAEGAMSEIEEMLQRMNELAIKGANGTMTSEDRRAINEEVTQLCKEIVRITADTTYNSQGLLDGSQALKGYSNKPAETTVRSYNEQFEYGKYAVEFEPSGEIKSLSKDGKAIDIMSQDVTTYTEIKDGVDTGKVTGYSTKIITADGGEIIIDHRPTYTNPTELSIEGIGGMKIQTGAEEGQEIQVVIPQVSLLTLGLADLDGKQIINCSTEEGSKRAIDLVNKAIDYISAARSKIGAYQNRIEKTISNLDVTTENLTDSYSTIKDLDMAEGMVEYTTLQVLIQAGTTMVAQANEQPQQALQLLQ